MSSYFPATKLILTPVVALLTFLVIAAAGPASAQAGCNKSGKSVERISKKTARNAIVCLFNKGRSAKNVKSVGNLKQAAQWHASVMAQQRCLSHQCPGEPNLQQRVARSGYLRGASGYELGEIVLAQPDNVSPRQIVKMWMGSSGHRAVIRKSSFDHVGVGLSIRNGDVWAAADFGHK